MLTFQNMRGRPALGGTSDQSSASRGGAILPRNSIQLGAAPHGAPIGRGVPIQGKTPHYHSFASAALDPHPAAHNPLLPFGEFTQAVIDGLAVLACLVLICATGVGLAAAIFFLFFCRF